MVKSENVGLVVATRELTLDKDQKVQVLIGKPEPCSDGTDWCCPHQILGVRSDKVRCAIGVDPMQALILGPSMVGALLYTSDEYEAGRLTWSCGAVKGDLGFPVPENIRHVLPGDGQSRRGPER